ncbi:DUF922 domain-containing protein [Hyunsoonleella pacifica]|uniref:DUF922 domain-containing protein n=1 Tax=Hyunsoonleella pacifica TaxID=1080224 RepID=A0A4Q9FJX4_9FLAO|nr:DUF922 domain-containing protein [Hyunsoonleella pacifica]TBN13843.1 DUF922 domain-containing protein [Hyunsoonleella pacifica]
MHKIVLVICLLLFVQYNDEPVMSWHDNYRLVWNDFKAKPKYTINAVAITASGITFGFSIRESDNRVISFSTEVHAHFYPEQSWYKPESVNDHVLGHEQLHFDITELFARKFRKRISLLKTTNDVAKRLREIHKNINKELAAFQNKYDTETDFSRNIEIQLSWEAFIKKELKKLDYFKSVD